MTSRAQHTGSGERKNGNKSHSGASHAPQRSTTAQRGAGEHAASDAMDAGKSQLQSPDTEPKFVDELKNRVRDGWEDGSAAIAELKDSVSDQIETGMADAKAGLANATESLGELADDTRAFIERSGRSLVATVKDNPLPAALIGLGCVGAGMMLVDALRPNQSTRTPRTHRSSAQGTRAAGATGARQTPRSSRQSARSLGDGEDATTSTAQRAMGTVTDGATALAQRAQKSIAGARQAAGDAMTKFVEQAGDQTQRLQTFVEENPLKAGAGAIAIGVGIGMLLPSLRQEHEWLGKGRDAVVERTHDLAHGMLEKLETMTQTVTEVVGGKDQDAESSGAEV